MITTSPQRNLPASVTHVLFFADTHDLCNVSDGLIGPEFYPSAHAALMRFVGYALQHIIADRSLFDSCVARLSAEGHGEFQEHSSLQFEKMQSLPTVALEAMADTYANARQLDSYQCFFKIARIPT